MSRTILTRLLLLLALSLLAACDGLGGEPEIVATLVPLPTAAPVADDASGAGGDSGAALFARHCAACHGADGRGDGAVALEADLSVPDFTDPAVRDALSFEGWLTVIREGRLERMMPPWQNSLTAEQIHAVGEYTYNLAGPVDQTVDADQAPVEESADEADVVTVAEAPPAIEAIGSIRGSVTNGTLESAVDEMITVALHVLDDKMQEVDFEVISIEDGLFNFDDIAIRGDQTYMVTALYEDTIFYSTTLVGTPEDPTLELPVTVYDFTTDPGVIEVDLLLTRISQDNGELVFEQIINFRNTSDRAYHDVIVIDQFRHASVGVTLPEDAKMLNQVELIPRFVQSANLDGIQIIDTQPVLPNTDHTVHVAYAIPFDPTEGSVELSYPVDYDMVNQVELMLQPGGLVINSRQLEAQGLEQFSSGTYYSYLGDPLQAGDTLTYTIEMGDNVHTSDSSPGEDRQTLVLVMMVSGIGLMMAAVGIWFFGIRGKQPG
ncbi:MAG: c-type cytochrome [Chloroflexota bacterium]